MTTPDDSTEKIERGYEQTGFEMVETHANLEVPTSYPALFPPSAPLDAEKAGLLEENLPEAVVSMGAYYREKDGAPEFVWKNKLFDQITEEKYRVNLFRERVSILPLDEDFSFKTFRRAVHMLEKQLDVELELEEGDE